MDEPKTCCPICGKDFYDELQVATVCPNCNKTIQPSDLIGPDDDYAWVI